MLHILNIFRLKSAAAALSLNEGEMERVMVIQKISTHPNLPRVNILVWYVILQAGCIYPGKECACDVQSAPDSERIEPAGALLRRRNSESVEQIQDREEFQVEPGRNLEIRVRGLNNKKLPPRPITAFTSQVGEVAVVRALASYKCGWGLVKANPHPNLPGVNILVWYAILQAGCIYPWKECACVIQLAHSPRPITASTSQVGEVAVVRTPVSYKCGWGSDKTNPHPNLPQLGKECALSLN